MRKIPVVTRNEKLIELAKTVGSEFPEEFELSFFTEKEEVIFFLNYEIPELKVFDFSDEALNCKAIADVIRSDSWLHMGGIIALCADGEEKSRLEEHQDTNILMVLTINEFLKNFRRLMRILRQNNNFVFNRGMQQYISNHEVGMLKCDNDPLDVEIYANLLSGYMYNTNRLDLNGRYHLKMALIELLLNALEHGNCDISYEEKNAYLETGGDILNLIAEKNKNSVIAEKKIYIAYEIQPGRTRFSIKDEGNGFDWRKRLEKKAEVGLHGMGITITKGVVNKMVYNEKGNQVFFEIINYQGEVNNVPLIFKNAEIVSYKDKELVCKERDVSNHLFFILSGHYEVYSKGKLVSVLNPNDIFIGEMAFLLNDRRSASIVARDNARVIRIEKRDFVNLIRNAPHYGLFLARLLARRLEKQTQKTIKATKELSGLRNLNAGESNKSL